METCILFNFIQHPETSIQNRLISLKYFASTDSFHKKNSSDSLLRQIKKRVSAFIISSHLKMESGRC
jgi:hypothetical protein